jgi:hypothetical protein
MKTYHRLESPTQTKEDSIKQQASMRIEGLPERNISQSDIPKAKAFEGSLPEGKEGVEFTTDIDPKIVEVGLAILAGVVQDQV